MTLRIHLVGEEGEKKAMATTITFPGPTGEPAPATAAALHYVGSKDFTVAHSDAGSTVVLSQAEGGFTLFGDVAVARHICKHGGAYGRDSDGQSLVRTPHRPTNAVPRALHMEWYLPSVQGMGDGVGVDGAVPRSALCYTPLLLDVGWGGWKNFTTLGPRCQRPAPEPPCLLPRCYGSASS